MCNHGCSKGGKCNAVMYPYSSIPEEPQPVSILDVELINNEPYLLVSCTNGEVEFVLSSTNSTICTTHLLNTNHQVSFQCT